MLNWCIYCILSRSAQELYLEKNRDINRSHVADFFFLNHIILIRMKRQNHHHKKKKKEIVFLQHLYKSCLCASAMLAASAFKCTGFQYADVISEGSYILKMA